MAKFHIELDAPSIETSVFVIEARNMEEAVEMALSFKVEPVKIITYPGDGLNVDYDSHTGDKGQVQTWPLSHDTCL